MCQNESASRMTMLKERIVNAEQMTLTTRTQLEAYEEGLTADHPFTERKQKLSLMKLNSNQRKPIRSKKQTSN